MSIRDADLATRLNDFLDRRNPPKSFSANVRARDDQIAAYLTILRKRAPQGDGLIDWWGRFVEALSEASETWAWPSEKDVWNACKAASQAIRGEGGDDWRMDPVAVNVGRIARGDPIGDYWLWGRGALQLVAAGADRHALRERRFAHAEALAAIYGPDAVRAKLAELKSKHIAAEGELSDWRERRDMPATNPRQAFTRQQLEDLVE